jgi:electron transport complex protein RnfA
MIPGQQDLTPMENFMEGIWRQNPIFVMVLGMCPALAVTVSARNALAMGVATTFVLVCSALLVSLIRKLVPREVRIATYIVIIATFVTVVASLCAYGLNYLVVTFDLQFLRLIAYIVVIASAVQLVEMVLKKYSPALFRALGIYLPLITTNCAVLGVALFQTAREYSFLQALTFAVGAGAGFTLALTLMASLRERLNLASVPHVVQGTALALMLAGLLSLTFMGFAGLGAGE